MYAGIWQAQLTRIVLAIVRFRGWPIILPSVSRRCSAIALKSNSNAAGSPPRPRWPNPFDSMTRRCLGWRGGCGPLLHEARHALHQRPASRVRITGQFHDPNQADLPSVPCAAVPHHVRGSIRPGRPRCHDLQPRLLPELAPRAQQQRLDMLDAVRGARHREPELLVAHHCRGLQLEQCRCPFLVAGERNPTGHGARRRRVDRRGERVWLQCHRG